MAPDVPGRQPLGHLSPNVDRKLVKSEKALTGSPLKRSFAAAIDNEQGFTYIKRRRPSQSGMLPSTIGAAHTAQRDPNAGVASFRFATNETSDDLPPLVSSQVLEEPKSDQDRPRDRDSSSERHSFSSLINYDPSSQALQRSSQAEDIPTSHAVIGNATRAEALRLRLRVAMYKVQTNQIHTPFDYLREQTATGIKESSRAVQEAVEQLRLEAQQVIEAQQASKLKSHAQNVNTDGDAVFSALRSSPEPKHTQATSPMKPQALTPRPQFNYMLSGELTSSAVKSNVAEGLLGLRNAL